MTKLLIVDQFSGLSPYWLQKNPTNFDELAAHMVTLEAGNTFRRPKIIEVEDPKSHRPEWCTTVFYEDADGMAKYLTSNWDTSG